MKKYKIYEPSDKMVNIISDDYSILQMLGVFGINMGFGDKTVDEVCQSQGVDTYTFLTIVNLIMNEHMDIDAPEKLSMSTLLHYLRASHAYYIDFELPRIRKALMEALDGSDSLAVLILKLYDQFAHGIKSHMSYEEKTLFPFVENLMNGTVPPVMTTDTFSKHHGNTQMRLSELKSICIKYLPSDMLSNVRLTSVLHDIYHTEIWLMHHVQIEEKIFMPAMRNMEERCRQANISMRISNLVNGDSKENLSDREKDVIIAIVQGMSNKEIANHLSIALNTVITHRRNIAKKLQIHTPAGLTIYAIVNGLIDIETVNL